MRWVVLPWTASLLALSSVPFRWTNRNCRARAKSPRNGSFTTPILARPQGANTCGANTSQRPLSAQRCCKMCPSQLEDVARCVFQQRMHSRSTLARACVCVCVCVCARERAASEQPHCGACTGMPLTQQRACALSAAAMQKVTDEIQADAEQVLCSGAQP